MSYINLPIKDNSTPLTPTEFNYLVDKLNLRKLRDLIDVQDADAQDKNIIRHNGSGWVFYTITDDHYTKAQINQLLGVEDVGGTPALTVNWGEIQGTIRDQADLVANFGDLKATQNIWDGKHFAENYILNGSTDSIPSAGTMDEFFITDGVNQVAVTDGDVVSIKGDLVSFDFANKEFTILNNPVSGHDYIDFNTALSAPSHKEGRLYWNSAKHSLAFYDDVTDVELNIGEEERVRVINANASTIFNGEAVSVNGVDPVTGHITVTHAIASNKESAINTIGIATHDIPLGEEGWVTISGYVNNVNSSAYTEGAAIYLSDTVAGAFQETRPLSPSYEVRMGGVAKSHATLGRYFVEPRIISNDQDNNRFFNGAVLEANKVSVVANGTTVNVSLNSLAANNRLSLIFDQEYVSVADGINIDLILGTDTVPLHNYVYIDSTGTMNVSTSGFPTGTQYVPVCKALVPSATFAQTYGLHKMHAYTDHLGGANGQGHLSHLNDWVRKRPASWNWGVALTTSVPEDTLTTRLDLTYSAGNVSQLHDHDFPAFSTVNHPAFIINDPTTPYALANGITSAINTDALGNSILNNRYYSIVLWGVVSEDEEDSHVYINLPDGSYSTISGLEADSDNLTNYAIPNEYLGTGFLIGELLLQRTTTSVKIIPNGIKDLRGLFPSAGGGGTVGGGGITRFDELVDVPSSKVGHSNKLVRVNSAEAALEYVDGSTLYALSGHTHDYSGVFAPLVHNHDSDYQAKVSSTWVWANDGTDDAWLLGDISTPTVYGHIFGATIKDYGDKILNNVMFYLGGLDAKYGLSVNGTDVSLSGHTHDYAATNHNHDGVYALFGHIHDYSGIYAAINHNHTGVYAPVSHTHTIANVTGLQNELDSKLSDDTNYAKLDAPNTFSGLQTITGSLSLTGNITTNFNTLNDLEGIWYRGVYPFVGSSNNNKTYPNFFSGLYSGGDWSVHDSALDGGNTGVGTYAMSSLTTGSQNTAIGGGALGYLTTGTWNVGVGMSALFYATGGSNTAIGRNSGGDLITGSNNIFVGKNAGLWFTGNNALTDANQSIFIGADSDAFANNSTNEIVIGFNAMGHGNNTVTLGNSSVTKVSAGANFTPSNAEDLVTKGYADATYVGGSHNHDTTYAPISHSHVIADVTGLQVALDGKALTVHSHVIGDTTGLQAALDGKSGVSHTHDYSGDFAALIHGHVIGDVTGLQTALDGKSSTSHNHDSSYAALVHTHTIANVTGLQTALDGKASSSHSHAIADVTGLQTALDGKASSSHNHDSSYAALVHTHTIANVTGLQTALDGKSATSHNHSGVYAPVSHSHSISNVTGLQTELDSKASWVLKGSGTGIGINASDNDYATVTVGATTDSWEVLVVARGLTSGATGNRVKIILRSDNGVVTYEHRGGNYDAPHVTFNWDVTLQGLVYALRMQTVSGQDIGYEVYLNESSEYTDNVTVNVHSGFQTTIGGTQKEDIYYPFYKWSPAQGFNLTTVSYATYLNQGTTGNYWVGNSTTMQDRLFHVETSHGHLTDTADTDWLRALRFGHAGLGSKNVNILASSIENAGQFRVYSYLPTDSTVNSAVYHGNVMLTKDGSTSMRNTDPLDTDGWGSGYTVTTPSGYTGIVTETTIAGFGMNVNLTSGTGGWARTMGRIQYLGSDKMGFGAYGSSGTINFMWFGGPAYNSGNSLKIDEFGNVNIGSTGSTNPSTSYKLQVEGVTQLDGKVSNTGGLRLNGGFYDTQVMQRVTINNVAHFSADNNRVQLFRGSLGDYSSVSNTSDPFFDMAMSRDNAVNGTSLVVPYFAMTLEGRRNVYIVSTRYAEGGISAINSGLQVGFSDNWVPDLTSTRCLAVNGTVGATAFYNDSLRKWKKNIKPFVGNATEIIKSLDIVTFDYKEEKSPNDVVGVIADDTHPYVLNEDGDAVDLNKVIFIQAKAMQEMEERIAMLEGKLDLIIKTVL